MFPSFGIPLMFTKSSTLSEGILFYLTMDAVDGSARLLDSVSNTWKGLVSNGTANVPGLHSNALSFVSDGFWIKQVSQIGNFYATPLPNTGWTLAGWIKLSSFTPPWFGEPLAGIFCDQGIRGLGFDYPSKKLFAIAHTGSCTASTTVALNTWTHAVMNFDGTTLRIYQDGALVGSTAASYTPGFAFAQIGNFANYYQLNGLIDEVVAYNRALSPTEIVQLYNGGAGRTYPL